MGARPEPNGVQNKIPGRFYARSVMPGKGKEYKNTKKKKAEKTQIMD